MIAGHYQEYSAAGSAVSEFALTAEQVAHSVEAAVRDLNGARSAYRRLGVENHFYSIRIILANNTYMANGIGFIIPSSKKQQITFFYL